MIIAILVPLLIKKHDVTVKTAMAKGVDVYFSNKEKLSIEAKYDYIAVLEIPRIKLKQGLLDKHSKYNTIQNNIQILNESMMPDTVGSNLFLAAHNGTSHVSFFSNLDKLEVGDVIYLYYQGNKYSYILADIYDVDKNGVVLVERDENKTTLTLITCKGGDDTKQVVYVSYLNDVTIY